VTDSRSVKAAKDFLARRIADQARQDGAPLSEVERKMLYFSETDWTLPDMETVSAEFDRDYDQDEYEQKIAQLVAHITADRHHRNEGEEERWDAAVVKLTEGDHYLLVLINEPVRNPEKIRLGGYLPTLNQPAVRPPQDFLKLILTAIVCVPAALVLTVAMCGISSLRFWAFPGGNLDDRTKFFLLLLLVVGGYFVFPRLWQIIRSRTNRP
jgi:hypothetical protein